MVRLLQQQAVDFEIKPIWALSRCSINTVISLLSFSITCYICRVYMDQLIKNRWPSVLSDLVHPSSPALLPPATLDLQEFQRGKATVAPSLQGAWLAITPCVEQTWLFSICITKGKAQSTRWVLKNTHLLLGHSRKQEFLFFDRSMQFHSESFQLAQKSWPVL